MHRYLEEVDGFFDNLFEFNDFSYFQELQGYLEEKGVSFKNMFLEDIIAYEVLRINLGFKNYKENKRMGRFLRFSSLFAIIHNH